MASKAKALNPKPQERMKKGCLQIVGGIALCRSRRSVGHILPWRAETYPSLASCIAKVQYNMCVCVCVYVFAYVISVCATHA